MSDHAHDPLAQYDLVPTRAVLTSGAIRETAELARVRALPPRPDIDDATVEALSRALCDSPAERLRPHQALALREFYQVGGLVAPLRVGAGKTLITLLAQRVLGALRAGLVVPAALREKTRRDFGAANRAGWQVLLPHIVTYEKLGHPSAEHELIRLAPDLLMFDEAHKLKSLRSASSVRRVARAIRDLRPRVAMLSGSMIGDKLMDYWHMLCWALGPHAPVPLGHAEASRWAQALDTDTDGLIRIDAGALRSLGDVHEHMRSRRGIVPTMGGDCDAEIVLSRWEPTLPPALAAVIEECAATGTRPDGELLEDTEAADLTQQLAQGFWYRWRAQPPARWLDPRREWAAYVRDVIGQHLPGFDSPSMVRAALDAPDTHPPPHAEYGRRLLAAWRAVRDTYEPRTVAEWIDDAPLRAAIERAGAGCLLWTRHTAAGQRLQQLGVPWCGAGSEPRTYGGRTVGVSIQAHGTGKNLQAYARNLLLATPANAKTLEQLMGRTHRPGQHAPQVSFDFYTATEYHRKVLDRVRRGAVAVGDAAGFAQKLTLGTWQ